MGWEGAGAGVLMSCPANAPGLAPLQNAYRRDPLRLVAVLKAILEGEKAAVLKRVRGPCPLPGAPRGTGPAPALLTPLCSAPGLPPAPQLPPAAGGAEVQPGAAAAAAPCP